MPIKKRMKKRTPNSNRGGTSITVDGIPFKSKLELYCYKQLKEHNIHAIYEGTVFTIIPSFIYDGEKIREMQYTPDFVGENFIIECKGHANESFPLRWKMFKYYLWRNGINISLYMPRNKKQIDETIECILKKN
jgi:hypothetical protein